MRSRIKAWSNPFLSADRKSLWIQADTDDGDSAEIDLSFELIAQLVLAAALAGQTASAEDGDDLTVKPDFSGEEWDPIPLRGVGLSLGRNASETALVVDLFRVRLAFLLDSKKVAEAGASFARMAATVSADPSKKI
jgi:hypothetical protein